MENDKNKLHNSIESTGERGRWRSLSLWQEISFSVSTLSLSIFFWFGIFWWKLGIKGREHGWCVLAFKSSGETFRSSSRPFWMWGCSWCSSMSHRFLSSLVIGSRLRCDCWPDGRPDTSGIEAETKVFFSHSSRGLRWASLTLQAASMVLHKAPLLGSQRKAWATNLSCAVWTMKAQFFTFFPMPKKLK